MWFPLHRSKEKGYIRLFSGKVKNKHTHTHTEPGCFFLWGSVGESYPDFSPSFTRDPAQYHGQRFEQPQQFLLHVSPGALLFPSPISLSNVSVGLVCISFPFCSRLPPGICATLPLRNCQLFLSTAILAPSHSLELSSVPESLSFHLLSLFYLMRKWGPSCQPLPQPRSAAQAFSAAPVTNGSRRTEREGEWSGTERTVFGGSFATALDFSSLRFAGSGHSAEHHVRCRGSCRWDLARL